MVEPAPVKAQSALVKLDLPLPWVPRMPTVRKSVFTSDSTCARTMMARLGGAPVCSESAPGAIWCTRRVAGRQG